MRKPSLLAVGILLALTTFGSITLSRHDSASSAAEAPAMSVSTPPAALPANEASTETANPKTATVTPQDEADLPTIEVTQRPVHTVTEDAPAPRAVTLETRDGRLIPLPSRSSKAAAPSAITTSPLQISGVAQIAGAVSLIVHDRTMPLFGVRAPQTGDRCAPNAQAAPRACSEVVREMLAARLKANAVVSCRVPPGQQRPFPAAICLDAAGIDLGGFLVAEGLALADPTQSYEYVGAESVARSFHRGLWRYR